MFTRRRSATASRMRAAGSPGRPDRSNTLGTGRLDEDASATLDRSHGSNDFHRLDLRSSAPARSAGEGSASADAARHFATNTPRTQESTRYSGRSSANGALSLGPTFRPAQRTAIPRLKAR